MIQLLYVIRFRECIKYYSHNLISKQKSTTLNVINLNPLIMLPLF